MGAWGVFDVGLVESDEEAVLVFFAWFIILFCMF